MNYEHVQKGSSVTPFQRYLYFYRLKMFHQNIHSNLDSMLVQASDTKLFKASDFKVVSKKKPNSEIIKNLVFAHDNFLIFFFNLIHKPTWSKCFKKGAF